MVSVAGNEFHAKSASLSAGDSPSAKVDCSCHLSHMLCTSAHLLLERAGSERAQGLAICNVHGPVA